MLTRVYPVVTFTLILTPANEDHVGRAGERGNTWAGRKGERIDGLRGRGSSAIWHHGGLEHRRRTNYLTLGSNTAQHVKGAVGVWPRG